MLKWPMQYQGLDFCVKKLAFVVLKIRLALVTTDSNVVAVNPCKILLLFRRLLHTDTVGGVQCGNVSAILPDIGRREPAETGGVIICGFQYSCKKSCLNSDWSPLYWIHPLLPYSPVLSYHLAFLWFTLLSLIYSIFFNIMV